MSFFGIHDIEGIQHLTHFSVHFSDLQEHKFRHKFSAPVPCTSAKLDLNTTNIFSCTALVTVIPIADTCLTVALMLLTWILETIPQRALVIYHFMVYVIPVSSLTLVVS